MSRSADNPADLVTRGLTVPDLSDATLWWHGPSWLSDDLSLWPSTLTTTPADIALAEREVKPEPLYLTAAAVESERPQSVIPANRSRSVFQFYLPSPRDGRVLEVHPFTPHTTQALLH